ncbi:MAG: hypothetical protein GXP27_14740 [Planctomycetes bacterium]|nr:hypothetical protein [Planctomycetota bacterium]
MQLLEDPDQLEYDFGFPSVLPEGLEVTEAGVIHGTPRHASRFRFVVEVGQKTDSRDLDNYTQQEFLVIVRRKATSQKSQK